MENAKTKLQSLGFTSGHMQVLTVAVAIFAVLFVSKSGVNWRTVFVHADQQTNMMTYEDALAQAKSQVGGVPSENSTQDDQQIALLDRSDVDGKVLGDAIGIGEIPDADQLLLPDITSQLKTANPAPDTDAARAQYVAATQQIENDAQITGLLADLNSSDTDTLKHSVAGWNWVINAISNVPVPPSLQKYHQDKLVYYSVLMNIGKIYDGEKNSDDLPLLTKAMLSYSQKVTDLQNSLDQQYKLNL